MIFFLNLEYRMYNNLNAPEYNIHRDISMNICDFCDRYGIKYFGIRLKIANGKKTPNYVELYKATPDQNDFWNLTPEELEERKQHVDLFDYIAMDTSQFKHVDVDFKDDVEYPKPDIDYVEGMAKRSAYFTSLTKKRGKHIIVKTDETFGGNRRPQSGEMKDVEILNGQWSYVKRTEKVYNPDMIYTLEEDDIDILWDRQVKSGSTAPKNVISPKPTNSAVERPRPDNDHQSYLLDLVDMLRYDDIEDYNSWTRLVWSLHNDEKSNNYEIAKYMSSKTDNYDEQAFNKLWFNAKSGLTLGSFIYYLKSIDERQFYKIKSKYFRRTTTIEATHMDLAEVFIDISGDNYVLKRGEGSSDLYSYHNNRWIKEDSKRGILKVKISKDLLNFYSEVERDLSSNISMLKLLENATGLQKSECEGLEKTRDIVFKIKQMLTGNNSLSSIAECVVNLLACKNFDDIEFDANGYLFAFKNKVFDLKTLNFVETQKEDYILTTCGYDYEDCQDEDVDKLKELFIQVFPDKDIRKYYLHMLATCMYGIPIEHFFLANGSGGNGKGVVNELMEEMLGNYAFTAPNQVLLQPLKLGNCPEVAGMKNKRMVIYREPNSDDSKSKICFATVKELTGGKKINARMNYSNDTNCTLTATHVLECNKRPKLDGRLDESVVRRVRDIPFVSTYTDDEDTLEQAEAGIMENVYRADKYFKSEDFKKRFKHALFKLLTEYIHNFHIETGVGVCDKFDVPKVIRDRSKEYIKSSDEIREWFDTVYERVDTKGKSKKDILEEELYVSIADMFTQFKMSDYYLNQSKANKRLMNKKYLIEYCSTNVNFKMCYSELFKSGSINKTNILIGFKFKEEIMKEDSEEECEDI